MGKTPNHKDRAHALLSASSAHRWLACPPSAVAAGLYEDTGSDYAAEGTQAHEVAESVARQRLRGEELYHIRGGPPEEMQAHAFAYADYIQEQMQPGAVVLLEQRVDFSDTVPGGFGTCDCLILQGDELHVIDYKYGKGVRVDAVDNPQLRLYALGALNDYGLAYDVARVIMHIFQPRLHHVDRAEMTAAELTAWAADVVRPAAAQAAKGEGDYSPGKHCTFCPHAGACRQLTAVCTQYVKRQDLRAAVPVLAPHEVAEVLELEPLLSLWLRRIKARALDAMLSGETVPGYKVVAGRPGNRRWTDEAKVAEAMDAAGLAREDYTETKLKSPAAVDKLLGKKRAAEVLAGLTTRDAGTPAIAPESDKRPAYNPAEDFDNLED